MASRFWVGGTGTWDAADTTNWAATSGGAGGASVPGASDTVTFDTNSGAAAVVTVAYNPTVISITRTGTVALTLTLGSSSITLSSTGTAWGFSIVTNLTVTANTATVTLTGANASWVGGGMNWNGLSLVMNGSGNQNTTSPGTVANFTRTGTAAKTDGFRMYPGTLTVTDTFTVTGNSATNRVLVWGNTLGTAVTITAATTSLTNVDFRDITAAGAAAWTGTSVGNALGNTGITFTTPVSRYAVATGNVSDTAVWSATTGGAGGASVPTCQDTIVLNAASGAITVTNDMPRMCADLTCTGFTGTLALGSTATQVYGSVTLGSAMTLSGTSTVSFVGRSSHTVTSAGKTWTTNLLFYAGAYALADALINSKSGASAISIGFSGTLADAGFSVSLTGAAASFTQTAGTLTASGTTTIASTTAVTPWSVTGGTVNHTGTIILSGVTATDRTFAGGGKTYGTLTYTVAGSTGALAITGANTFTNINFSDANNARTLTLPASATTTITGDFNVQGTAGNLMTVNAA